MNVLVTGGSGSFGRAFVQRLIRYNNTPRICIYSRGEHQQAKMREDLGDNSSLRWFIGDIRDRDRLRRAMTGIDIVVHAAALKRIEVGAYNPIEMCKTNIEGAINVIEAARDAKVDRVVALSTDKAYQPVSPYGFSKALAESLFISANDFGSPKFTVMRYGNVAGSAGSVIPKWREALAHGRTKVNVTDPDCTRFWMTIVDAVTLVLHTISTMRGGELVIPTLPAYRLGDLAEAMGLAWEITGLPDYEKKHESMREGLCSETARRMSVDELREALKHV